MDKITINLHVFKLFRVFSLDFFFSLYLFLLFFFFTRLVTFRENERRLEKVRRKKFEKVTRCEKDDID